MPLHPLMRWLPLPNGYYKINMDAAFSQEKDTIGISLIARNQNGDCIGWKTYTLHQPLSPESAEAIATLKTVEFGASLGWRNIYVEGDCLSIIKGIMNSSPDWGVVGAIYEDIRRITSDFNSFKATHVYRKFNYVAHRLAKLASYGFAFPSVIAAIVSVEHV